MAIFHLAHSFVRRSNGSSSIATAAYNSGEKLDDNKGSPADYTRNVACKSGNVPLERLDNLVLDAFRQKIYSPLPTV